MDLTEKIKEFKDLKRMSDELQQMVDELADELKAHMIETNQAIVIIGEYKLSYKEHTRTNIKMKSLKEEHEEIFAKYSYITRYRKLLVN